MSNDPSTTLEDWLKSWISGTSIIDLRLILADIIHFVVAVISRIVFASIQQNRSLKENVLPTMLMMDEAHNFIN